MRSRWLPWVAAGLVAANLAAAIPVGLYNTFKRLRAAVATVGLGPREMRARVFGRRYTAAIESIRRIIPPDEPYVLEGIGEPGDLVWVRSDLLPRRSVLVHPGEPAAALEGDCLLRQVRWQVVAIGFGKPPLLVARPAPPAGAPGGCPPAPWLRAAGTAGTAKEAPAIPTAPTVPAAPAVQAVPPPAAPGSRGTGGPR
jgi:hypothetical protein